MIETLIHEMIHAYLFVVDGNRERESHGTKFKQFMKDINSKAGTNISVYHTFHDEVNHFKKHVWRCNGPCKERKPFFGWVRRAMNRAPGKYDRWWAQHQRSCGGSYIKISEPPGYKSRKKKKRKLEDDNTKPKETKRSKHECPVCRRVFSTENAFVKHGDVCGLGNMIACERCGKRAPLIHDCIQETPNIIFCMQCEKMAPLIHLCFSPCPICKKKFPTHQINDHVNRCLDAG